MNQINGYCQIELPDRIALDALKTEDTILTDAEVKPIIKALNLDQVKYGDNFSSFINAWLNKPVIVKAYTGSDVTKRDVKSIFHASSVSNMKTGYTLGIQFSYMDMNDVLKHVTILLSPTEDESSEIAKWEISIFAHSITFTEIQ